MNVLFFHLNTKCHSTFPKTQETEAGEVTRTNQDTKPRFALTVAVKPRFSEPAHNMEQQFAFRVEAGALSLCFMHSQGRLAHVNVNSHSLALLG